MGRRVWRHIINVFRVLSGFAVVIREYERFGRDISRPRGRYWLITRASSSHAIHERVSIARPWRCCRIAILFARWRLSCADVLIKLVVFDARSQLS